MADMRKIIAASLLNGLGTGLGQAGKTMNEDLERKKEKTSTIQDYEYYKDLQDPDARKDFMATRSAGLLQPSNKGTLERVPTPPTYNPPTLQEELVNIETKIKRGEQLTPQQKARYEALQQQVGKKKKTNPWE